MVPISLLGGNILTPSLSWTHHIHFLNLHKIPQNPRPYLPPSFHCSSNPHTIIKLYSSLCTSDTGTLFPSMVPSFSSLSHKLESVQNLFAINIPSNFHCTSYSSNLPSLSSRRVQAHLKILFFISHNCFFFSTSCFQTLPSSNISHSIISLQKRHVTV